MQEITEALLTREIAQLSAELESHRALITALVFKVGKGKRVTISKGEQRQADQAIDIIDVRRLSTGELRFTPTPPQEAPK